MFNTKDYSYSSGNRLVDMVGKMSFTGDVIPHSWHTTILTKAGKPDAKAMIILAKIVYWYRPTELISEGRVIGIKKKFKGDLLQYDYETISDATGFTKKEARNAIVALEELGVIKRHFRNLHYNGKALSNVMFIEVIPARLAEVTFPKGNVAPVPDNKEDVQITEVPVEEAEKAILGEGYGREADVPANKEGGVSNNGDITQEGEVSLFKEGGVSKIGDLLSPKLDTCSLQNPTEHLSKIGDTYTKNTTQTTAEITTTDARARGEGPSVVCEHTEVISPEDEDASLVRSLFRKIDIDISTTDAKDILKAAKGDMDAVLKSYDALKNSTVTVERPVGFMIKTLRDGVRTPVSSYTPSGTSRPRRRSYDFENQRTYDFAALEVLLVANPSRAQLEKRREMVLDGTAKQICPDRAFDLDEIDRQLKAYA